MTYLVCYNNDMDKETLISLIESGATQNQIAQHFGKSQTTARYWLDRHGLKTLNLSRSKIPYEGKYVQRICKHHGLTNWIFEKSKPGYRCVKCRSGRTAQDRRNIKIKLVSDFGGKCIHCGYNKSFWALEFHHRDPSQKRYNIGFLIRDRKYELAYEECLKCDLVCANCHAEQEEKFWVSGVIGRDTPV